MSMPVAWSPRQYRAPRGGVGRGGAGKAASNAAAQAHPAPDLAAGTLNPLIAPLEEDGVVIDRVNAEWVPSHAGMLRVALLNNFGGAGSNTAVLLEEYIKPQAHPVLDDTLPALEEFRTNYMDWLRSSESANVPLVNIAYTVNPRRQIYSCQLAVSACTRTELLEKLESAAVMQVQHPSTPPAQAIFVFSGQGSQYLGMGRRLYNDFPLFRRCIDECQHILISSGFPHGVLPIIRGTGRLTTWEVFEAYQVAIFALETPDMNTPPRTKLVASSHPPQLLPLNRPRSTQRRSGTSPTS
ncbi:hypothetical protein B0H14DRAFT_3735955 [Mycena olivaceomarginata]|nr:hypothetical protein B0H14DRAFT_3735955 [Mycena olivaceomarginata]